MPPRPTLPADDLYARLEIAVDASPEVIEVAWRSLLRLHHPDIAGPSGLERSKRINVAHDWLGDPVLRARYDRERGLRTSVRDTAGRDPRRDDRVVPRAGPATDRSIRPRRWRASSIGWPRSNPTRSIGWPAPEPPPIAFAATIARFLPPDLLTALEEMEAAVDARLDPAAAARPGVRDAVEGYATELVLGSFLDELLSEPFRDRTRERLTRGWDAAVGQPRYGPNGASVRALIARLTALDAAGVAALAATARRSGIDDGRADPWPPGTSPEDDEALRVSSILAARDAAAAIPANVDDRATATRARRAAARLAHLLVLRHAFAPASFAALTRPWRPRFLPGRAAGAAGPPAGLADRGPRLCHARGVEAWLVAIGAVIALAVVGVVAVRGTRTVAAIRRPRGIARQRPGRRPFDARDGRSERLEAAAARDRQGARRVRGVAQPGRPQRRRWIRIVTANAAAPRPPRSGARDAVRADAHRGVPRHAGGGRRARGARERLGDRRGGDRRRGRTRSSSSERDGRRWGAVDRPRGRLRAAPPPADPGRVHRQPVARAAHAADDRQPARRDPHPRGRGRRRRDPAPDARPDRQDRGRDGPPRPDGQRAARPVADRERRRARRRRPARPRRGRDRIGRAPPALRRSAGRHASRSTCLRWSVPAVRGDEARLGQVFVNLLHNAVKFSPDGGEVRVSVRASGDDVVVAIEDHGVGIPRAAQARGLRALLQGRPGARPRRPGRDGSRPRDRAPHHRAARRPDLGRVRGGPRQHVLVLVADRRRGPRPERRPSHPAPPPTRTPCPDEPREPRWTACTSPRSTSGTWPIAGSSGCRSSSPTWRRSSRTCSASRRSST